jgi:thiol-disulfide isomerase/thioredoxin
MKKRILLAAAILAVLAIALGAFYGGSSRDGDPQNGGPSNEAADASGSQQGEGYGFGRIEAFTATDLQGNVVSEDIFRENDVTFVNYWATWCGPCRDEMPDFQALYDAYGDRVGFITVVQDSAESQESADFAAELSDEYLSFCTNLNPEENLVEALTSGYVPTSALVDKDGYLLMDLMVGALGAGYAEYIEQALEMVGGK